MDPIELAASFVAAECDFGGSLELDEDVFKRIGVAGDDATEFFDAFAAKFSVDMSNFRWYFHYEEEGFNLGAAFFEAPEKQVKRIPVSLRILADAITQKAWPIKYPEHGAPIRRPDLLINRILVLGVFGGLLLIAWNGLIA